MTAKQSDPKPKRPRGKPKGTKHKSHKKGTAHKACKYTDEIAAEICARLENRESLHSICKSENMPSDATVRAWARDNHNNFSIKYARAREIGYLKLADEIIEIADKATDAHLARNQIDARKWVLSKVLPKVYGDRIEVNQKLDVSDEFESLVREIKRRPALQVIEGGKLIESE